MDTRLGRASPADVPGRDAAWMGLSLGAPAGMPAWAGSAGIHGQHHLYGRRLGASRRKGGNVQPDGGGRRLCAVARPDPGRYLHISGCSSQETKRPNGRLKVNTVGALTSALLAESRCH
jgi:hypothetical protein